VVQGFLRVNLIASALDAIILFPQAWGLSSVSELCVKLHLCGFTAEYLPERSAGIDHHYGFTKETSESKD
jgi:hypothetical protein